MRIRYQTEQRGVGNRKSSVLMRKRELPDYRMTAKAHIVWPETAMKPINHQRKLKMKAHTELKSVILWRENAESWQWRPKYQ